MTKKTKCLSKLLLSSSHAIAICSDDGVKMHNQINTSVIFVIGTCATGTCVTNKCYESNVVRNIS